MGGLLVLAVKQRKMSVE